MSSYLFEIILLCMEVSIIHYGLALISETVHTRFPFKALSMYSRCDLQMPLTATGLTLSVVKLLAK